MKALFSIFLLLHIFITKDAFSAPQILAPTQNLTITSPFGHRVDPISGATSFHKGVDIKSDVASPVFAVLEGKVIFSGPYYGFGNLVVIEHQEGFLTRYAHLADRIVYPGDWVEAGSAIGHIGETGRATGVHLHFELYVEGEAIDPMILLSEVNK